MNHIVRGRLLLNVTLAAVLLGALLVASPQAQSIVLPLAGLMLAMIVVNTYLAARTSAQVGTLRTAALRMSTGDFSEPVPQTSEEPLANLSEILERVRKQLNQQTQEIARHLGAQVLVSYADDGGYGHPDHVRCHDATRAAAGVMGRPFEVIVTDPDRPHDSWYVPDAQDLDRVVRAHHAYGTQFTVTGLDITHVGGQRQSMVLAAGLRRL